MGKIESEGRRIVNGQYEQPQPYGALYAEAKAYTEQRIAEIKSMSFASKYTYGWKDGYFIVEPIKSRDEAITTTDLPVTTLDKEAKKTNGTHVHGLSEQVSTPRPIFSRTKVK